MTRSEALQLFGLPDAATDAEIRKKYGDLYNDNQLRLTNAPTPNLKKLYQKNLEELNAALSELLAGEAASVMKELPSSAPVYDQGNEDSAVIGRPPTRSPVAKQQAAAPKGKGAAWGAVYVISGIGVLAVAACIFLLMRQSQTQAEMDRLSPMEVKVQEMEQEMKATAERYAQGTFKLTNEGEEPFSIYAVIATYVDVQGNLKKFESELGTEVGPGSTVTLNKWNGGQVVWDGSVVSFACLIDKPGNRCPIIHSGLWADEQKDGALHLNLDAY